MPINEDNMLAAPEDFDLDRKEKIQSFKEDIYSLGLIACKIMAKEMPNKYEIVFRRI